MKTYTLEVLTEEDDDLVTSILDALRKRNLIRFTATEGWSRPPASEAELAERITAALASPRLSFEEARQRLGL